MGKAELLAEVIKENVNTETKPDVDIVKRGLIAKRGGHI